MMKLIFEYGIRSEISTRDLKFQLSVNENINRDFNSVKHQFLSAANCVSYTNPLFRLSRTIQLRLRKSYLMSGNKSEVNREWFGIGLIYCI